MSVFAGIRTVEASAINGLQMVRIMMVRSCLGRKHQVHCCFRILFKISLVCHVKRFQISVCHMEKTISQFFTSQAAVQIDGCSL